MKGKKLLVFSILCIAAGLLCLLFSGVRSSGDLMQALDRIGAVERQEKKSVDVTEPFTGLLVQEASADVQLLPSEDGGCRVVYGESEFSRCRVDVENGTLTVVRETEEHSRKGLFSIEDALPVSIYLPAGDYEALSVTTASGDVKASSRLGFAETAIHTGSGNIRLEDLSAGDLNLSSTSGDVRLENLEAETLSAKTGSGKVKLRGCSAASLKLESSSGDLTVKASSCTGDGQLRTGSGDIELEDSSFRALDLSSTSGEATLSKTACSGSVKAETGSGNIRLRKAAGASFDLRSTSGDVKGSVIGPVDFIVDTSSGSAHTKNGQRGAAPCQVKTGSGDVDLEAED